MDSSSIISSDSDSSCITYPNDRRQSGSASSLANFTPKNLCPTNLLKFSMCIIKFLTIL